MFGEHFAFAVGVREPLEFEDGFESFGGAVGHYVALASGAEAPAAPSGLAPADLGTGLCCGWVGVDGRLFVAVGVACELLTFEERQGFLHHGTVLGSVCQSSGDHCLDGEGRVPGLHAVGAVHHHATCRHPQEVMQVLPVLFDRMSVGSFFDEAAQIVHWRVDRRQSGIISIRILDLNQTPGPGLCSLDQPVDSQVRDVDHHQQPVDQVEDPRLGVVVVSRTDRVPETRPSDFGVGLSEELLSQFLN